MLTNDNFYLTYFSNIIKNIEKRKKLFLHK